MIQIKFTTLLFFATSFYSFSQGTWSELNAIVAPQHASDIPKVRHEFVTFTVSGIPCISTGESWDFDEYYNDLYGFDVNNNLWMPMPAMPVVGRSYAVGGTVKGKGFITLGNDGTTDLTDSWEFDPGSWNWNPRAPFPGPWRLGAFSFTLNNKFYVGGGRDSFSSEQSDFYEYNPDSNAWFQRASLPFGIHSASAFSTFMNGYVVGGEDSTWTSLHTCFKYDPVGDSWSMVDSFPGGNPGSAASDSLFGYVAGDDSHMYKYDPMNGWTQRASIQQLPQNITSGDNGLFYELRSDRSVTTYDPVNDVWTKVYEKLDKLQIGQGPIVMNNLAYFAGAKYDLVNDQWSEDTLIPPHTFWIFNFNSNLFGPMGSPFSKFDLVTRATTPCSPCPLMDWYAIFSTNSYGYIYGLDSSFNFQFWQYNPTADTWTRKADFPGNNHESMATFGLDHKGFFVGGEDSNFTVIDDFWEYNEWTDTWTQRPDAPSGPRLGGRGLRWNGLGIIAFGMTNTVGVHFCDINLYNDLDSSWTTVSHPLGCRGGEMIFFTHGSNLYGGRGEFRYSMGDREELFDFWKYQDNTIDIPEYSEKGYEMIYPNPSLGEFWIMNLNRKLFYQISITDLSGRIVYEKRFSGDNPYINFQAQTGMYIVSLSDDSKKILVGKLFVKSN